MPLGIVTRALNPSKAPAAAAAPSTPDPTLNIPHHTCTASLKPVHLHKPHVTHHAPYTLHIYHRPHPTNHRYFILPPQTTHTSFHPHKPHKHHIPPLTKPPYYFPSHTHSPPKAPPLNMETHYMYHIQPHTTHANSLHPHTQIGPI